MYILSMIIGVLQAISPPALEPPPVRGDRFQIIVPQGWKTLNEGSFVLLQHASGASLLVQRVTRPANLTAHARRQAERIMTPLGFAKLGEPLHHKDSRDEWVEYEIVGNRISQPHRIAYRILRKNTVFFESIYEAPESHFEVLLTEAQGIASSVQTIIETSRPRKTRR